MPSCILLLLCDVREYSGRSQLRNKKLSCRLKVLSCVPSPVSPAYTSIQYVLKWWFLILLGSNSTGFRFSCFFFFCVPRVHVMVRSLKAGNYVSASLSARSASAISQCKCRRRFRCCSVVAVASFLALRVRATLSAALFFAGFIA